MSEKELLKELGEKINSDIAAWKEKLVGATTIDYDVYTYAIDYGKELLSFIGIPYEEKPEIKDLLKAKPIGLPEGIYITKFEMSDEKNAEQIEIMFELMIEGTHDFRSAVNLDKDVRTVMCEKGKSYGTPMIISTVSKEMAWSLQQTIDWVYKELIKVVAVRRKGSIVEMGYIKLGIPELPKPETYIYYFEKTDGWTLEKHDRKRY